MQDLNDLHFFAAVVAHKGFSPAARALGVPKSRLSKHVAKLENELGVRLLERSSRGFRVTDIGQDFYRQCEQVLEGVQAAEAIVARARAEPQGTVRVSCPAGLSQNMLAAILPGFLAANPKVRVEMSILNRRVDLVEEPFDVALRVRTRLDTDPNLTMRTLATSRLVLAAAPAFIERLDAPLTLDRLASVPTLSPNERVEIDRWELTGADGARREVTHSPRLSCSDFNVLRMAALDGLGVALLPDVNVEPDLREGRLVQLLPDWWAPDGIVHMVFTTRRGLLPSVRAFVDHLAREFPRIMQRCKTREGEPPPASAARRASSRSVVPA